MKKLLTTFFVLTLSCNAFAFEGNLSLSLTSNYVFRGITQTDDKAAVQANYQISQAEDAGFYAGIFASNVAQGAEVDVFGGFKFGLGNQNQFVIDIGAIEYMYTVQKPTFSHDSYVGLHYGMSYIKYNFGEEEARYLDLGTGFVIFGDAELLFHFGEVFSTAQDGNDISISLQKKFDRNLVGISATYEDKTPAKKSEVFAYISVDF